MKDVLRNKGLLALTGFISAIFISIFIFQSAQIFKSQDSNTGAQVIINEVVINVEIADESRERQQGLMFRESLSKDTGMLFIFEREGTYSFWMKNMKFSIDIIWINSDWRVVHVEQNLAPCFEVCPIYVSENTAMYVLEVNSGFANEHFIKEGSRVKIVLNDQLFLILWFGLHFSVS